MEPENELPRLRPRFSREIDQYGIKAVFVVDDRIEIQSNEQIPYALFNSIECELL